MSLRDPSHSQTSPQRHQQLEPLKSAIPSKRRHHVPELPPTSTVHFSTSLAVES